MSEERGIFADFTAKNTVLVLILNQVKKRERVLIGDEALVRAVLEGKEGISLPFDRERELGQLLLDWEAANANGWACEPLREALRSRMDRTRQEEAGRNALLNRAASGDPISLYTASKCWEAYCDQRTARGFQDRVRPFDEAVSALTGSFGYGLLRQQRNYAMKELLEDVQSHLRIHGDPSGVELSLWYPWNKDSSECLVIRRGVLPAVVYYLHRLREWGLCWCCCKRCGRWFLASSRHHSLCSQGCRQVSGRENKRNHDAAVRDLPHERDYTSCYQRLNKRLKKYCGSGIESWEAAEARTAFASFRDEAKLRKKRVQTPEQAQEFREWLLEAEQAMTLFLSGEG